jgi:hypothetical protein
MPEGFEKIEKLALTLVMRLRVGMMLKIRCRRCQLGIRAADFSEAETYHRLITG